MKDNKINDNNNKNLNDKDFIKRLKMAVDNAIRYVNNTKLNKNDKNNLHEYITQIVEEVYR